MNALVFFSSNWNQFVESRCFTNYTEVKQDNELQHSIFTPIKMTLLTLICLLLEMEHA